MKNQFDFYSFVKGIVHEVLSETFSPKKAFAGTPTVKKYKRRKKKGFGKATNPLDGRLKQNKDK